MKRSVGLRVTSLKWTGPVREDPDASPEIPQEIDYPDTVPRAVDIGFDEEKPRNGSMSENGMALKFHRATC